MVSLGLSAQERAHLAALGVTADGHGVLRSASGREVSPGTAVSLLEKAVAGYPDVRVTPGRVPDPSSFDRPPLREGHAAENVSDWTVNVPPHGAVGVIGERAREHAEAGETSEPAEKKAHGKRARREQREARRAKSTRAAEESAFDEGPRTHTETVKAMDPAEFRRGYLAAGHQADSPAVTGVRAAAPLPPSNAGVLEPEQVDRRWLQPGHQALSPGDEGDNSPVPPGGPGWEVYDAARAAYDAGRSAAMTSHVEQTGGVSSSPAPARWEPSPNLGASSMPHSVSAPPVGRAPGE